MESIVMMRMFLRAFMILLLPMLPDGEAQFFGNGPNIIDDYMIIDDHNNQEQEQNNNQNDDAEMNMPNNVLTDDDWFEIEVEPNVKSTMDVNRVVSGITTDQNQDIFILDTKRFEKALVIDKHLQSSEMDEYVYHESLTHPALLIHDNPRMIFIMGGAGGAAVGEVLKHKHIEKVIMCDIDWEVVNLCREHSTTMDKNFHDRRFRIVYNNAKDELERSKERYDVIIGDLTHPTALEPCKDLYTKPFYEEVLKPKLNPKGIFVTQAGQAGIFSHKVSFLPIYKTLKQCFSYVVAYTAHIPSFGDTYGWIMASDEPINFDAKKLKRRIGERIGAKIFYIDEHVIVASTALNKTLKKSLNESDIPEDGKN